MDDTGHLFGCLVVVLILAGVFWPITLPIVIIVSLKEAILQYRERRAERKRLEEMFTILDRWKNG